MDDSIGNSAGSDRQTDGQHRTGRLFVISAPSGAGKTTLCRALRDHFPDIRYSVSYTTRPPRKGEQDGVDYFFVSTEEFMNRLDNGRWAEWARVHDNYYGTSRDVIDTALGSGKDVLLDIDVQGAARIAEQYPRSVTIFIMPPSMAVLEQRLTSRGTDTRDAVEKRLANARAEMAERDRYQHVLVNDRLADAAARLISLVQGYRSGRNGIDDPANGAS